jgi:DNA-binding CsgD family transcriptional regulator
MRVNAQSCSSASLTKQPELPSILSKFQIDGHQFLIISLENHSGTKSSWKELTQQFKTCIEVERFKVQGQLCAIVEVEQSPSLTELDITTLLTDRELQIATLVALGHANKQIAKQLCISEWTVSTHLRRIFIKLDVDSRAAMVYRCAPIIQKLFGQVELP